MQFITSGTSITKRLMYLIYIIVIDFFFIHFIYKKKHELSNKNIKISITLFIG